MSQLMEDSLNGIHQADSLAAFLAKQVQIQDTTMAKEEAHFKVRYENADPAQKVYEVLYELKYN